MSDELELGEAVFSSSPDALLVVDHSGKIRRANAAAELLFGYAAETLASMTVEDLLPEKLRETHRQHRMEYQADPKPRRMGLGLELTGLRQDDREIPLDIAVAPLVTAGAVYTLVSVRRRVRKNEGVVPQLFRVISGKNPFQAWLMVFFFIASLPLLFNTPAPNSIEAVVPHSVVLVWAFLMCVATAANLVGVYWRSRIEVSIWLEMSSCIALAIINLLYPASIITFTLDSPTIKPGSIWFVSLLLLGITVCAMGRFYQLLHDRREVSEVRKLIRAAGVYK